MATISLEPKRLKRDLEKKWVCWLCHKYFLSKEERNNHIKQKHPDYNLDRA